MNFGAEEHNDWVKEFNGASTEDLFKQKKELVNEKTGRLKLCNQRNKKNEKDQKSLHDLWGNIEKSNGCIIGVPGEKMKKKIEKVYLKK